MEQHAKFLAPSHAFCKMVHTCDALLRWVWLTAYPRVWTMTIKAPATGLPSSHPQNLQTGY